MAQANAVGESAMTIGTDGVIAPAAWWRLAIIFDAPGGDRERLARDLAAAGDAIRAAAGGAAQIGSVRLGVATNFMNDLGFEGHAFGGWRRNDAAVEVTVSADQAARLADIAAALRPVLEPMMAPDSAEVMAGPTYFMIPPRLGDYVLSLSFKRYPGTSKQDFSRWWYYQHSAVAIPVMGERVLGYDQVHCDDAAIDAVSAAFGVAPHYYDAYDNLTLVSWESFASQDRDPEGSRRIAEDEIGRIDNDSRRHAVYRVLG